MLADMGADVIKIERIPIGDDSRQMLTPSIKGESAAFMMMNRNKRGLALDLKKPKGQEVLKRLVKNADALIENYRKGTMEKFGLGYESLKAINPGLIYCEISGFGRTGPMASQGGFDLVTQGMSGLMSITGEGPGRPPVKVGAPITDITAGPARLHRRQRRLRAQAQDRPGPARRHLAVRGRHHPDLLAVGHRLRHRRLAGPAGLGPSPERALPGLRDQGRLDHARRLEPEDVAASSSRCSTRPTSPTIPALPTTPAAWPTSRS